MNKKESEKPPTLADLAAAWKFHKREEIAANEARGLVEAEIVKFLTDNGQELPEKGTTTFKNEGIKIVTGIDIKWDQDILARIHKDWISKGPPWPFTTEYKPDNAQIKYLRENVKAIWDRIKVACVEKDKKPSFSEK